MHSNTLFSFTISHHNSIVAGGDGGVDDDEDADDITHNHKRPHSNAQRCSVYSPNWNCKQNLCMTTYLCMAYGIHNTRNSTIFTWHVNLSKRTYTCVVYEKYARIVVIISSSITVFTPTWVVWTNGIFLFNPWIYELNSLIQQIFQFTKAQYVRWTHSWRFS